MLANDCFDIMNFIKPLALVAALAAFLSLCLLLHADDQKTPQKLISYTLKVCIVSGEKLGEMGDPYVFAYKGREIKLCCKNCRKDFDKDPAKYIKKIEEAEAKAKANANPAK